MTEARSNARPPSPTASDLPRPALAAALVLAVVAALGLHTLFVSGPAMREAAGGRVGAPYLRMRIGMSADSSGCDRATAQFTACSGELAIVRQKQSDRDHAAAAGIL